jgi:hypothetical protein
VWSAQPLTSKAGVKLFDVAQNIVASTLLNQCLGREPVEEPDSLGEKPRGCLIEIPALERGCT